MAFG
ncbi:hypothetical protein VCCP10303_2797, partial [Vibrio cholerae CP1030(3)]|jgi:hypothetical protein